MPFRHELFRESDLVLISRAKPWPIMPGALVRLRSGGPIGIVKTLTNGWHGRASVTWLGIGDDELSAACLDPAVIG